ncbi:MAG: hypothetical protein QM719_02735 [Thermomonas sp.]
MKSASIVLAFLCLLFAARVQAQNAFPWKWGMSPVEVQAVTEYAPYRAFTNGDLETYEATFQGQKKNYQFYFDDSQPRKLWRIEVVFYEGMDIHAASKEWLSLYGALTGLFGEIETPDNSAPVAENPDSGKAFGTKAEEIVRDSGKTQMAPIRQPSDEFVFASLRTWVSPQKETYYNVVLYFDKPGGKSD